MSLPDLSIVLGFAGVIGGSALGIALLWRPSSPPQAPEARTCSAEVRGLTDAEVWATMRRYVPRALPCVPATEVAPEATLHLRLEVACTGQVEHVEVTDAGDWPEGVLSCVIERMSSATFPPHGLQQGTSVDVPIKASFRREGRPGIARGQLLGRP